MKMLIKEKALLIVLLLGYSLLVGCQAGVSIKPTENPGATGEGGGTAGDATSSDGGVASPGDAAGGGSSTGADVETGIAPAPQPGGSPGSGQVPETLMLRGRIISPVED